MMMTVNAPPITMSLVIFVGCWFDLSFMFFIPFVWLAWRSRLKPCQGKERGKKRMYNNYWAQERSDPFAAYGKKQKIKRDKRAVSQHAAERDASGPTTHAQRKQGDAEHTRHRYNNASKFLAE